MKIKTITCHDVYNHGASLQAYALMKYLQMQGHDVKIIDYKPDYLSNHYKLTVVSNPKWDRPFFKQLYLLLKLPGRILSLKRKKQFDLFRDTYLKITTQRYTSNEELKQNPPKADLFIAGSDQIWNTLFPNGKDAAFYLDFASAGSRKISYAASFATDRIYNNKESFVKNKIGRLDAVSVRESSALNLLNQLSIKKGVQVVDPVFLLEISHWKSLIPIGHNEKFILVYDFEENPLIKKVAQEIAQKQNCKIYTISPSKSSYAHCSYHYSGPLEFLELVSKAEMVISNSFHGTAFAIIFKRDFLVVNRSEGINARMQNLLNSLGIGERLIDENYDFREIVKSINYTKVDSLLSPLIEFSKLYLDQNINESKK